MSYENELARDLERGRVNSAYTGNGRGPAGAWPDGVPTADDQALIDPPAEERGSKQHPAARGA